MPGGLMWAGILAVRAGLGVVAARILDLPRGWTPVAVGPALPVAAVALRAGQRRSPWRRT
jgi:hypothetical protein